MKVHLYFLLALLLLCSCKRNDNLQMRIAGTVSARFNGQKMYLLPLPHPTPQNVDSTYIKNGQFTFTVPADSSMYDITISNKANAMTQRLLVIAEKGELRVHIDTTSTSSGTILNDRLQQWKEEMERVRREQVFISNKMMASENNKQILESLQNRQDSLVKGFRESTFLFVKQNINPLGGFIFFSMNELFNENQISRLKSLGIEKWKPKG
jgi:hypothetical protein